MIADVAFSLVLGISAVLSALITRRARPAAHAYLQLAAALYLALAGAEEIGLIAPGVSDFADAVTDIVCALGPATLALSLFAAFEHPPKAWIAASVLTLACFAGIGAALGGAVALSFATLAASVFAILALCARAWRMRGEKPLHAIIAALCLLAAAASVLNGSAGGHTALALFSASGLLGISLALVRRSHVPVAEPRGKGLRPAAIGGRR